MLFSLENSHGAGFFRRIVRHNNRHVGATKQQDQDKHLRSSLFGSRFRLDFRQPIVEHFLADLAAPFASHALKIKRPLASEKAARTSIAFGFVVHVRNYPASRQRCAPKPRAKRRARTTPKARSPCIRRPAPTGERLSPIPLSISNLCHFSG